MTFETFEFNSHADGWFVLAIGRKIDFFIGIKIFENLFSDLKTILFYKSDFQF